MAFNITLQNVANFCSTHADLLPLSGIGGFTNEPFLSIANDAISDLLSSPNDWKFNRKEMPMLVTCPQKQDYFFAGAVAFSLGPTAQGWAISQTNGVHVNAGVVTVTFIEQHRFAVGDTIYLNGLVTPVGGVGTPSHYNSVFTDTGAATGWTNGYVITAITPTQASFASVAGQNDQDTLSAPGITDFNFATSASMVQMVNTSSPQYSQELTVYREQPVTSFVQTPEKVAVIGDDNNGTLKIRFYRCPGTTTWGVKVIYQAKAPVKQSLGDNWAPFSDDYSALYRQAVIYRMYRFLRAPEANIEYQKLQQEIQKFQAGDDAEETSISIKPDSPIMSDDVWWGSW